MILTVFFIEIKLSISEHVVSGNMFRRPNTSITNYLNFLFNILMLTLGNEYKKTIISGNKKY